jgi:adenylate cyclase, class 2
MIRSPFPDCHSEERSDEESRFLRAGHQLFCASRYTLPMSAHEVEIKFSGADPQALAEKLRLAGFRLKTPRTHEMNTLYDRPGQPLRRKGQLLRLRKYGSEWLLTHKGKGASGRHKTRLETQTKVADGDKMDAILQSLGYKPSFQYEKFRAEWTDGTGEVVIDETPIGNFGEIEGPPEWIDRTARALGIDTDQYITSNYAELFLNWKKNTRSKAKQMTFRVVTPTTTKS